jgi:hypothetical protein
MAQKGAFIVSGSQDRSIRIWQRSSEILNIEEVCHIISIFYIYSCSFAEVLRWATVFDLLAFLRTATHFI